MSGPSWRSAAFDFFAASRSWSRSRLPTLGMSRSMMNFFMAFPPIPSPSTARMAEAPGRAYSPRREKLTAHSQVATDHDALHVAGAFVDLGDADVAPDLADR